MYIKPDEGKESFGISDDALIKAMELQRPNIALLACGPMGEFYIKLIEDDFYEPENVIFTVGEGDTSEFHPNKCVLSESTLNLIRNRPEEFLKKGFLEGERKRIDKMLKDKNIVILSGCAGDPIGSCIMPAVFDHLNKNGITTFCLVTKPFSHKGRGQRVRSASSLERLKTRPMHTMVVDLDRVEMLVPRLPEKSKYRVGLEYMIRSCKFLLDSTNNCLINTSLENIRNVFLGGGELYLGLGKTDSNNSYMSAFEEAISSPIMDLNIGKVRKLICQITGGSNLTIEGASEIIRRIEGEMFFPENLYLVDLDPCLEGVVEITVMASQENY